MEAGATIFGGSCLVGLGGFAEGLCEIEKGLALAHEIGDQERILIGLLHRGRALIALDRAKEARAVLQEGLRQAETSQMHRLRDRLCAELASLSSPS